jgi:hypothetical protein
MNPSPIFNLFSLKAKAPTVVRQGISILIIGSVALSLVALTACMQVEPAGEPVAAVAPPQAETSGQSSIEILPTIDPADRKFFNPGYGTISGVAKEAETLPTVDPADRKFFTPGYGVNAPKNDLTAYHQSEWNRTPNIDLSIEDLPTIDPADRKFFTPGYGAQTVLPGEPGALPNIDPADRKFFNSGYGVQMTSAKQSEAILPSIENEFGEQIPIWFLLK